MKLTFLSNNLLKRCASLGMTLVMLGTPQLGSGEEHVVRRGDTLTGISQKYYGTITLYDELAHYNGIADPSLIRVGQVIEIPDDNYLHDIIDYYEVKKGDTLWKIANKYYQDGKYWSLLGNYNGITNQYILRTGTVLIIPNKWILDNYNNNQNVNNQISNSGIITYIFQGNDTLWNICKKYYGSGTYSKALANYNNIDNPRAIRNGTELLIPSLEILKNYTNPDNEEIIYGNSLDKISLKYYGTKDYAYLLSLINGIEQCGPYHEKDLIIPKQEYLDNYLDILNKIEPEDTLSNYYVVQKGDTLTRVSILKYGTDEYVDFLADINALKSKHNIRENDVLYVPGISYGKTKKLVLE